VLFERIVLKRRVAWVNLESAESRALDSALAAAEPLAGVKLPRIITGGCVWRQEHGGPSYGGPDSGGSGRSGPTKR